MMEQCIEENCLETPKRVFDKQHPDQMPQNAIFSLLTCTKVQEELLHYPGVGVVVGIGGSVGVNKNVEVLRQSF